MSNLAAQFLVALALAAQSANAAVTCSAGFTAKTSVDDKYCMGDAASCKMDPTCCTAPKTCASEAASITCDTDFYNKMDTTATGSDAKAACCMTKATCASATCADHMEKVSANSGDKCSGGATTCDTSTNGKCCKDKTGTCYAWYKAGNTCDNGSAPNTWDWGKTGSDKAACCSANVQCSTHTCPSSTHKLMAGAENIPCSLGSCTNEQCCQCKSTTCCGATVACGTNMYRDSAKNNVIFTDKATDCCTARAQCKDSEDTSVSGAPVLSSFLPLFSAFSMLGLVLGH